MVIFISQPMADKSDEEILQDRVEILQKIKSEYGDVEFVNSFVPLNAEDKKRKNFKLVKLGWTIKKLAEADAVYFADGWQNFNGCCIEHECAERYGIEILHD